MTEVCRMHTCMQGSQQGTDMHVLGIVGHGKRYVTLCCGWMME